MPPENRSNTRVKSSDGFDDWMMNMLQKFNLGSLQTGNYGRELLKRAKEMSERKREEQRLSAGKEVKPGKDSFAQANPADKAPSRPSMLTTMECFPRSKDASRKYTHAQDAPVIDSQSEVSPVKQSSSVRDLITTFEQPIESKPSECSLVSHLPNRSSKNPHLQTFVSGKLTEFMAQRQEEQVRGLEVPKCESPLPDCSISPSSPTMPNEFPEMSSESTESVKVDHVEEECSSELATFELQSNCPESSTNDAKALKPGDDSQQRTDPEKRSVGLSLNDNIGKTVNDAICAYIATLNPECFESCAESSRENRPGSPSKVIEDSECSGTEEKADAAIIDETSSLPAAWKPIPEFTSQAPEEVSRETESSLTVDSRDQNFPVNDLDLWDPVGYSGHVASADSTSNAESPTHIPVLSEGSGYTNEEDTDHSEDNSSMTDDYSEKENADVVVPYPSMKEWEASKRAEYSLLCLGLGNRESPSNLDASSEESDDENTENSIKTAVNLDGGSSVPRSPDEQSGPAAKITGGAEDFEEKHHYDILQEEENVADENNVSKDATDYGSDAEDSEKLLPNPVLMNDLRHSIHEYENVPDSESKTSDLSAGEQFDSTTLLQRKNEQLFTDFCQQPEHLDHDYAVAFGSNSSNSYKNPISHPHSNTGILWKAPLIMKNIHRTMEKYEGDMPFNSIPLVENPMDTSKNLLNISGDDVEIDDVMSELPQDLGDFSDHVVENEGLAMDAFCPSIQPSPDQLLPQSHEEDELQAMFRKKYEESVARPRRLSEVAPVVVKLSGSTENIKGYQPSKLSVDAPVLQTFKNFEDQKCNSGIEQQRSTPQSAAAYSTQKSHSKKFYTYRFAAHQIPKLPAEIFNEPPPSEEWESFYEADPASEHALDSDPVQESFSPARIEEDQPVQYYGESCMFSQADGCSESYSGMFAMGLLGNENHAQNQVGQTTEEYYDGGNIYTPGCKCYQAIDIPELSIDEMAGKDGKSQFFYQFVKMYNAGYREERVASSIPRMLSTIFGGDIIRYGPDSTGRKSQTIARSMIIQSQTASKSATFELDMGIVPAAWYQEIARVDTSGYINSLEDVKKFSNHTKQLLTDAVLQIDHFLADAFIRQSQKASENARYPLKTVPLQEQMSMETDYTETEQLLANLKPMEQSRYDKLMIMQNASDYFYPTVYKIAEPGGYIYVPPQYPDHQIEYDEDDTDFARPISVNHHGAAVCVEEEYAAPPVEEEYFDNIDQNCYKIYAGIQPINYNNGTNDRDYFMNYSMPNIYL